MGFAPIQWERMRLLHTYMLAVQLKLVAEAGVEPAYNAYETLFWAIRIPRDLKIGQDIRIWAETNTSQMYRATKLHYILFKIGHA